MPSDSLCSKCRGAGNFICPIVSPVLANTLEILLDYGSQRFPYRKYVPLCISLPFLPNRFPVPEIKAVSRVLGLGIHLLITTYAADPLRLCLRLISEPLDPSYKGARSRSLSLLWAISRKGGKIDIARFASASNYVRGLWCMYRAACRSFS
jgi:hypothetical protein